MQSAAVIPFFASSAGGGAKKGLLPRLLPAVAVAVAAHGVLLLGNGTGVTSTTLRPRSLAVRFIETSAPPSAPSVVEPSTAKSIQNSTRPEADARSRRDVSPPVGGATVKPALLSRPSESPIVSVNAQPVAPITPSSPESPAGPSARALADAPDYLLAKLLSVGPRPLEDIQPQYPEGAELRTGKVVLRLLIGDTGHVDDVAVVRASPPGLFDASAIEAFAKARFSPGLAGGVAVKSQITVEVEFVPLNRLSRISGRSY